MMLKIFLILFALSSAIPIMSMEKIEIESTGCEDCSFILDSQDPKELYLVVGSYRGKNGIGGEIVDAIHGSKNVDTTYQNIAHKNITTIHELPCAIVDVPHIEGDASTYNFDKPIRWVFIENPATTKQCESAIFCTTDQSLNHSLINHVGNMIMNIAKYMPKGAVMEIEWFPYTGISSIPIKTLENAISQNPFHSFVNMDVILQGVFILSGEAANINILPDEMKNPALQVVDNLKQLLEFYEQQNIGRSYKDMLATLYWEARVIHHMYLNRISEIFLDYQVLDQDAEKLRVAMTKWLNGKIIAHVNSDQVYVQGAFYRVINFWRQSFLGVVVANLAAEHNRSRLIKYLNTLDFEKISVERRDNPYTKRKNVWMIKMVKR